MNKVMLIGRLGVDPEMRQANGTSVCSFTLATSEKWTDKSGQKQQKTEWHRVVAWGIQADLCGRYLKKGSQVFIEGKLQTRSWETKEGQKQHTTEIVSSVVEFLGSKSQSDSSERPSEQPEVLDDTPPF